MCSKNVFKKVDQVARFTVQWNLSYATSRFATYKTSDKGVCRITEKL